MEVAQDAGKQGERGSEAEHEGGTHEPRQHLWRLHHEAPPQPGDGERATEHQVHQERAKKKGVHTPIVTRAHGDTFRLAYVVPGVGIEPTT